MQTTSGVIPKPPQEQTSGPVHRVCASVRQGWVLASLTLPGIGSLFLIWKLDLTTGPAAALGCCDDVRLYK